MLSRSALSACLILILAGLAGNAAVAGTPANSKAEDISCIDTQQDPKPSSHQVISLGNGVRLEVTDGSISAIHYTSDAALDREYYRDLLGTHYRYDSLDETDVTRQLWRTLDLRIREPDGSLTSIKLLRPLWWLDQNVAPGRSTVHLAMREMGIEGVAEILSIGPCQVDSRDNTPGTQVVTGTFKHENAAVLELVFDDDVGNPLAVTANHMIFSEDRDTWTPAGQLEIGESVRTISGIAVLTKRSQRPGRHTTYNLEVHRSHNFYVSQFGILVHNSKACSIRSEIAARTAAEDMRVVRPIRYGEKVAGIIEEAKRLTFETGQEHALVKLASGERALVSGGPGGILFKEGQISRIFGHTHPYHLPPTPPSAADLDALRVLGQRSSYLLQHGELFKFFRE